MRAWWINVFFKIQLINHSYHLSTIATRLLNQFIKSEIISDTSIKTIVSMIISRAFPVCIMDIPVKTFTKSVYPMATDKEEFLD